MTREDIIRMALEVGLPHWYHTDGIVNEERVIAFANLVASAEREACAKIVEESSLPDAYSEPVLLDIADDIRARKNND